MKHAARSFLKKRAFTLIEIMVATVIMIIMVGLVIQITSQVLNVWNRSADKLSSNADARIAMELLTSDLETAVFRNNGLQWMEVVQEQVPNPLGGPEFQTTRLLLFAPALDRPQEDAAGNDVPGDICAISYQLVYQDPVDGEDTEDNLFALHRRLIDPKTTFEVLLGEGNQETFDLWIGEDTVTSSIQRNTNGDDYPATQNEENYLSSNVVDFRVTFYYINDLGDEEVFDTETEPLRYGGTNATIGPGSSIRQPLAYADISLQVISKEAMQLLRTDNIAQSGFADAESFVAANSEFYKRRIYFPARPL
ncbi:MAG: prepilin-type N-terminal cleavage/methylation domain-containing protein [Verrucomicrobiota bacterium]